MGPVEVELVGPGFFGKAWGGPIKLGEWWIGVECQKVDEALREQLNLAEGIGVVVIEIVPDSPAAKAGLKKYDVLVKAGEKELRQVQDLVDAINEAKDQPLSLELIRRGQKQQLSVTPAKRPQQPGPTIPEPWREWFERWQREGWPPATPPQWRFRFWYPGRILPPGAKAHPPLPGNLTITITKKGDEPAKIVVKRDGQTWEVTEDQLGQLPPDIRQHVEGMLRGGKELPHGPEPPGVRGPTFDWDFPWFEGPEERRLREQLERRVEELQRRIDELRQSVEELRKRGPILPPRRGPQQSPRAPQQPPPSPPSPNPAPAGENA